MDLKSLIDAFLASYQGRDPSLLSRLAFWRERLGDKPIASIDADMVDALDESARRIRIRPGAACVASHC